jgi:hypothetical protein
MPVQRFVYSLLIVTALAQASCTDLHEGVTAADIRVETGPDGTKLFQPGNSEVATSAYAQWLQLRADLAGIASTGDYLDTQVANLNQQRSLLRRGKTYNWSWQRLHGTGDVNFTKAIALVDKRVEALRPTQ